MPSLVREYIHEENLFLFRFCPRGGGYFEIQAIYFHARAILRNLGKGGGGDPSPFFLVTFLHEFGHFLGRKGGGQV